jgi:hypothetical protein
MHINNAFFLEVICLCTNIQFQTPNLQIMFIHYLDKYIKKNKKTMIPESSLTPDPFWPRKSVNRNP